MFLFCFLYLFIDMYNIALNREIGCRREPTDTSHASPVGCWFFKLYIILIRGKKCDPHGGSHVFRRVWTTQTCYGAEAPQWYHIVPHVMPSQISAPVTSGRPTFWLGGWGPYSPFFLAPLGRVLIGASLYL